MGKYNSLAFVYYGPRDMRAEIIVFECGPREMALKVRAAGRCGTDKIIFRKGHHKVDSNAPVVLGHEFVAEVVEVGDEVRSLTEGIGYWAGKTLTPEDVLFSPGERVTVQGRIARYRDGLMLLDDPINIVSFYIDGAYSQYMHVPEDVIRSGSVLRIPNNVSDAQAVLVEPAACALESIFSTPHPVGVDEEGRHIYRSGIRTGGNVCVIGSGSVSMIYALLARIEGAERVLVLVRSEAKAELVKKVLGDKADPIIAPHLGEMCLADKMAAEDKIVAILEETTDGYLFDDVVAACPDPDAQRLMLKLYNRSGYAVGACYGGTHELVDGADVDQNHYRAAKTIGTSGTSNRTMQTVINWLSQGRLDLAGFASECRYALDTPPDEFFSTDGGGLKPVLYPWE